MALAPADFLVAMIVPMMIAVWLIDGAAEAKQAPGAKLRSAAVRNAFTAGWWWGFGYFVAGFWWLGAAFLVEPQDFVWAMPLGIFGLPAFLALFPALWICTCASWLVGGTEPHSHACGPHSASANGCVSMFSQAFRGTIMGWRLATISYWRNSHPSADCQR